MIKKQFQKIKGWCRTLYFKIYDRLWPPPPIQYIYCDHCWLKYPWERGFIEQVRFDDIEIEIRNERGQITGTCLGWTFWLNICCYCKPAPAFRLYKAVIHPGGHQSFWINAAGDIYERFEIPTEGRLLK